MNIHPEKETDFAAIYDLVTAAFKTAQVSNGDEQNFVTRLRGSENYIAHLALIAEDKGKIIGHIMLTHTSIQTTQQPRFILLLAPLAVAPEHQGKKIGTRLIEEACKRAKKQGHKAVILVGNPLYYERFGFKPAVDFGIDNTNGIPPQYVMIRELVPHALDNIKGAVTFST